MFLKGYQMESFDYVKLVLDASQVNLQQLVMRESLDIQVQRLINLMLGQCTIKELLI